MEAGIVADPGRGHHRGMTTLYGISNCDTVKRARAWLDAHGVAYRFHDFKKDGVPEAELAQQHPQGRGRADPVEQDRHAPCAEYVQIVNTVRTGTHPGDHAQHRGTDYRSSAQRWGSGRDVTTDSTPPSGKPRL
jgi:glutaredoxin